MPQFTYMGTKRRLASRIASTVAKCPPGPFLDLFAGLSAVGAALAPSRNVWCNDMQHFANAYSKSMFACVQVPDFNTLHDELEQRFSSNMALIKSVVGDSLIQESAALSAANSCAFIEMNSAIATKMHQLREGLLSIGAHCLFTASFAGGYFGLRQAAEIDSIRYSIDSARNNGLISDEDHNWLVVALCKAVAFVSNSTGHFAQYLTPSLGNSDRVMSKRRRSVWACWVETAETLCPYGTAAWRQGNRTFHKDATDLLAHLLEEQDSPTVIYADPPYTSDQYSRYYHILETVVLYDYPSVSGKGLYRNDRFTSKFSLKARASEAFRELIERSSALGASLLLSYPTHGLLPDTRSDILHLLHDNFATVLDPIVFSHEHSTMGGSKGQQKHFVEEILFVAHA
ncbi:DNA adenine methylase [Methylorubrum aminovorans]